jgi:glycosyltransferase involved in cell wall biosynthesis
LEAYLPSVVEACRFYQDARSAKTEIIVVEDAGGDDTVQWLESHYPANVRVMEHKSNQGFCLACQTGFENARFPVVLLLNNDVRLKENCIASFVDHFQDPDVFSVT